MTFDIENGHQVTAALAKLGVPIRGELRILYLRNPLKAIVLIDREYFGTYEFEKGKFVR